MNKQHIIKCPKCGREYLPAEIFMPTSFMGKPTNIIKDEEGKIEFYEGPSMELSEEYICDNCGCTFEVDTIINFKTKEVVDNFDEVCTVDIYPKDRIQLEEPKL